VLPAVEEQLLEHVVGAAQPDRQVQGQPAADDHLLHVVQLGAGRVEHTEQPGGDPRAVSAGAAHQDRPGVLVHRRRA
jgi:hypothetical protein